MKKLLLKSLKLSKPTVISLTEVVPGMVDRKEITVEIPQIVKTHSNFVDRGGARNGRFEEITVEIPEICKSHSNFVDRGFFLDGRLERITVEITVIGETHSNSFPFS
ncbi:MAG: hypothetical protein J5649_02145 [Lachnospiraceae bacterium]|nr:hypothetical protein [Lachnospiraceae bacterium]